jgi:hypothetical protein
LRAATRGSDADPTPGSPSFSRNVPVSGKSAKAAPEKAVSMRLDSSWPLRRNLLKQREFGEGVRGYHLGK